MVLELLPGYRVNRGLIGRLRPPKLSIADEHPQLARALPRLGHIEIWFDATVARCRERDPSRNVADWAQAVGRWFAGCLNVELERRPLLRARYAKATPPARGRWFLLGPDDLEVLADEDVVRPVDGDHVDVVLAVAQQRDTVDGASGVGRQRSSLGPIRCCPGDDRARPFTEIRRDLTDLLGRARIAAVKRDDLSRRSRVPAAA